MTVQLPLFPLGTVLFPGALLPLHIFEPRYRALVQELLAAPEGSPRRFGVVAIRAGREVGADGVRALHEVGCTADLRGVQPYSDGRYDVVSTGGHRFRLREIDRESRPYLLAEVDLLAEAPDESAEGQALVSGVQRAFTTYLAALDRASPGTIQVPEQLPDEPLMLSYLVAATVLVDVPDKQALLAEPDAGSRLRAGLRLLRRETLLLRRFAAAPAPDLIRQPLSPN